MFNTYFFSQFSDRSSCDIEVDLRNDNHKFNDLEFHALDVLLILKQTNSSKAAGPDGIDGILLKNCAASLAKPLTIMFNTSYVSGIIPEEWKLASVVPVHKKGEKDNVENYRPISLTCLVMKIFERCIQRELFAVCAPLLDPRQQGFVNYKLCTIQMIPFTNDLTLALNNKSRSEKPSMALC